MCSASRKYPFFSGNSKVVYNVIHNFSKNKYDCLNHISVFQSQLIMVLSFNIKIVNVNIIAK